MSIIIDLHNDFIETCENKSEPYEKGFQFFKANSLAFYNVTKFDNLEEVTAYKELSWKYLQTLSQIGHLNDVLDLVLIVIPVLDPELDRFNIDKSKDIWYKGIIRLDAEAAYGLKDYETALKEYKLLLKLDPENDVLKKWVDYCRIGLLGRFNTRLGIISFACIVISMLLINYKPRSIGLVFLYSGLVGLAVVLTIEGYNQRSRRRSK